MENRLKRRGILAGFIIVTLLLGGNIFLTYRNSLEIERNNALQNRSDEIKSVVRLMAIDVIHNLDLGIRSYALFRHERYLYPYHKALEQKDSLIERTRALLTEQDFPLPEFEALADSVDAYVALNKQLRELIHDEHVGEFFLLADRDQGYRLWLQFEHFANTVDAFEATILQQAKAEYKEALRRNYILQLLLFIICVPTLLITTVHTLRAFQLERQLFEAEKERADLLDSENSRLEEMVGERTSEISEKNRELQIRQEEIEAQNEEMRSQNEQLVRQQEEISAQRDLLSQQNQLLESAQQTILQQQREIQQKNALLEIEVDGKTRELINRNQQLEQFAFVAAHNLRAPVARILGLGNILKYARETEEAAGIMDHIILATVELDAIIKDLTVILEIKNNINSHIREIRFAEEMRVIRSHLQSELTEAGAIIHEDFSRCPSIKSVKAYIDSILYNLVSNAIKYRAPGRVARIEIYTTCTNEIVDLHVRDNGLGIDLEKHGREIFSLYKRFHLHIEGKGMGLHLVKVQAAALGGNVEVSSVPGEGTAFIVHLPMKFVDVVEANPYD